MRKENDACIQLALKVTDDLASLATPFPPSMWRFLTPPAKESPRRAQSKRKEEIVLHALLGFGSNGMGKGRNGRHVELRLPWKM
jgi:hypothetical protein